MRPFLTITLAVTVALSGVALAQPFPFETESMRKPTIQTGGNVLIRGGRILTAAGGVIENGDILVRNGKIEAIGPGLRAPSGFAVIDARGKHVMPGIVDGHSHRMSDGTNEGSDSITVETRIGDVLNPFANNVWQALASGHTSALILHGSANSMGGESISVKYKFGRPPHEAMIEDAPRMVKFALGENVTRKSGNNTTRFPRSRMGVEAVFRRAFTAAREYMAEWEAYEEAKRTDPYAKQPRRDLRLETISDILRQKVWVHCHSYRSDEMLMMVRLSQEFGFKIGALQHALEAYKIAPELAEAGVGVSIFVDNWSFKQEGYDSIPFNAAICTLAGVEVSINTDGLSGTTALNIDAAKTMRFGGLTEDQAIRTITINTANQIGIGHRTGSIEVGKDADISIWDGHPLSVYSKAWMTLIEGEVYFQRRDAFNIDRMSMSKPRLDPQRHVGEAPMPPRSNIYAIIGATVHTVSGPTLENATVLVRDGRIVSVGERVVVPGNATPIDGTGLHVYPGFIDGGSSMGLLEISPIPVMVDNAELGNFQPDLDALTALWVESAHYGPARYNGVTNAFIRPSSGIISGQGALIHTDGYTPEQFGLARRAALVVNFPASQSTVRLSHLDACCDVLDVSVVLGLGGSDDHLGHGHHAHQHAQTDRHVGTENLTVEELRRFYDLMGGGWTVQENPFMAGLPQQTASDTRNLDEYFDQVREYRRQREADPNTPRNLSFEAMYPYLDGERLLILRARNAASIRAAVAFAQKHNIKVALSEASEAWREAKLLADSGIPVILNPAGRSTLGANTTDNPWDPYDTPYVSPGILARAGVKFAFMSGSGSDVMNLPVRVGQHCAYGLRREDAIRALTLWPAEIFGVADQIGSIEPGKLANFIVTDGDPFEMTTSIRHVFIEGQPRSLETKHTRLRDRYMARVRPR